VFRAISRRLALLNALVVIAVIAAVGLSSYLYLARKIETQTDAELRNRSASAVQLWTDVFLAADARTASGEASPSNDSANSTDSDHEEHDDDDDASEQQAKELVRSGDTIAYGIDLSGEVVSTLRPVTIEDLPKRDSIERALDGSIVVETITVHHDRIRLRTEPVLADGRLIGAIQVGMGLGPNEQVLDFVRWTTIGGLILGALLAVPTGWWLANRSMRPIREAFGRQRAFVADASHELRTPLTLIRAEAEYQQRSPDLSLPELQESRATIIREVDSMAGLVSSLLQLARMDESAARLVGRHIDLAAVAAEAVERFQSLAADREIALGFDTSSPAMALGDRAATDQVVSILLDNAFAYTPAGGTITLRTGMQAGKATLAVTDSGIGISPTDQQRIFDRFYRGDPARSRSSGGAGLGLSIASELMAAQHGRIMVESEPGAGSTFTLHFDAA